MTRKKRLPETERVSELGSLGGFGPEETAQLVRLRELLIKHLVQKFEVGVKITYTETAAALTLLRRSGLIDPEDAPETPEETPAAPPGGPAAVEDAPGSIQIENAKPEAPVGPVQVRSSDGTKMLTLPFPVRNQ